MASRKYPQIITHFINLRKAGQNTVTRNEAGKSVKTRFLLYSGKFKKFWNKHFIDGSGVNFSQNVFIPQLKLVLLY